MACVLSSCSPTPFSSTTWFWISSSPSIRGFSWDKTLSVNSAMCGDLVGRVHGRLTSIMKMYVSTLQVKKSWQQRISGTASVFLDYSDGSNRRPTCRCALSHSYKLEWVWAPGNSAICVAALGPSTPAVPDHPAAHTGGYEREIRVNMKYAFQSEWCQNWPMNLNTIYTYQASTKDPPSPLRGHSISISRSQWSFRGSRLSWKHQTPTVSCSHSFNCNSDVT